VSEILSTISGEILCRDDAKLTDVDFKHRLITVVAVPWEQEATIYWRGEAWKEVFLRGAFDGLEDHAGRVRVNREHTKGDTVGAAIKMDTQDPHGLIATVEIIDTPRGDETLKLAAKDMISASIGYFIKTGSDVELNIKKHIRRVKRAFLDHLSFVESPAFEGARVLSVREGSSRPPGVELPPPEAPALDEFMNDPVFQWARSRTSHR
jgi:HK97 family phage prohead protease